MAGVTVSVDGQNFAGLTDQWGNYLVPGLPVNRPFSVTAGKAGFAGAVAVAGKLDDQRNVAGDVALGN